MINEPERSPMTNPRDDAIHASAGCGVSWSSIFAGAAAAAAISLILLLLGSGLGLSTVSPWAQQGVSATTFGVATILWITFTSLVASAVGGYLAGRLRVKWLGLRNDEVFFRDTAHGLLAWAVATLLTAAFLTSAIGAIVGSSVKAGASVAGSAIPGIQMAQSKDATAGKTSAFATEGHADSLGYFIDSLFRADNGGGTNPPPSATSDPAAQPMSADDTRLTMAPPSLSQHTRMEVVRIFANSLWTNENLPESDVRYVGQLVAQQTELSPQDAEARVNDVYTRLQTKINDAKAAAKEAADKARKASAYGSLWLFISLLIGAFIASVAATFGGRQRDL